MDREVRIEVLVQNPASRLMHDVAIVGAGPYGLSLAAHLSAHGVDFRIFGTPMQTWQHKMPRGMRLKSEGFASTLYDPDGRFPLSQYCADNALDYADVGRPVRLDVFIDYGLAFQRRFASALEAQQVVSVRRAAPGFAVSLEDGTTSLFRTVVLAVGITHFDHVAEPLRAMPQDSVSHSSARSDYSGFAGRRVVVVGGGSSATDCAAALSQSGASVQILTRRPKLKFHTPPTPRTLRDRMRSPTTTIGRGWKSVLLTRGPLAFQAMPEHVRHDITGRFLGPASCWFTRDLIETTVDVVPGVTVTDAAIRNGRIELSIVGEGGRSSVEADHVVAATGYKVDVGRLSFIEPRLRDQLRTAASTPILSRWFESSVPGLYFVGVASANTFGPLVRFACGAQFTARRLTKHLTATRMRVVPRDARRAARPLTGADRPGDTVRGSGPSPRSLDAAWMHTDRPDAR